MDVVNMKWLVMHFFSYTTIHGIYCKIGHFDVCCEDKVVSDAFLLLYIIPVYTSILYTILVYSIYQYTVYYTSIQYILVYCILYQYTVYCIPSISGSALAQIAWVGIQLNRIKSCCSLHAKTAFKSMDQFCECVQLYLTTIIGGKVGRYISLPHSDNDLNFKCLVVSYDISIAGYFHCIVPTFILIYLPVRVWFHCCNEANFNIFFVEEVKVQTEHVSIHVKCVGEIVYGL